MSSGSVVAEVVHDVEGVINNEPLDGVLEVRSQHLLAVDDLFHIRVVVVLNLQLVHIELGDAGAVIQPLHEFLLAQQVELPQLAC